MDEGCRGRDDALSNTGCALGAMLCPTVTAEINLHHWTAVCRMRDYWLDSRPFPCLNPLLKGTYHIQKLWLVKIAGSVNDVRPFTSAVKCSCRTGDTNHILALGFGGFFQVQSPRTTFHRPDQDSPLHRSYCIGQAPGPATTPARPAAHRGLASQLWC